MAHCQSSREIPNCQLAEESNHQNNPNPTAAENYQATLQDADFSLPEHNFSQEWINGACEEDWQLTSTELPHDQLLDLEHELMLPTSMETMIMTSDEPAQVAIIEQQEMEGCFLSENLIDGTLYQSPNYQIPSIGTLTSESYEQNQFNSLENQDITAVNESFIYTNETGDQMGVVLEQQELVPVDNIVHPENPSVRPDNPNVQPKLQDSGSLYYEPPCFFDAPFFCCDLVQSSTDLQQEYSPLGIRQLMSSLGSFTPLRLWDSPSQQDEKSPEAVLRSAAKSFTGSPSILKKRNRDPMSPLSGKRCEKRLERDVKKHETLSNLAKDFSRSDFAIENKENMGRAIEVEENEGKEGTTLSVNSTVQEVDSSKINDKIKDAKGDAKALLETSPARLVEHEVDSQLPFSPDRFGTKSDRNVGPNARTLGNQSRRFEETTALNQRPESSSSKSPCIFSPCTRKNVRSPLGAPSSTPMSRKADKSANDGPAENPNLFGGTPFKRSIESPSAWKSPWFNSFLPGPRVDTEITVEDIGIFTSPGERRYDAIGLMKQLSEHTASAFAAAQEVLGNETPDSILKKRCSMNEKADPHEVHRDSDTNVSTERRVLDFSECEKTPPVKARFSSPSSSYLLKSCR